MRHPEARDPRRRAEHRAAAPSLAALDNVELAETGDAVGRADVVVLLVDHREFKHLDRSLIAGKSVVDTRGVWRSHA